MQIKCFPNNALDDINLLSIAVGTPHQGQQHIGILHNYSVDGTTKFLHLESYNTLSRDLPNQDYIWVDVDLDEIVKITLIAMCELIYNQNQNSIPYGISMNKTAFDTNGNFVKETEYGGLTCATFVMQVFKSQSIDLIDFTNWPIRAEDKAWQVYIIKLLKKHIPQLLTAKNFLSEQMNEIAQDIQRYRPEEVAAASALPNPPHGQETLTIPSQKIKRVLSAVNYLKGL